MRCPSCSGRVKVVDVVHNDDDNETYKAKECVRCHHLFYTVEYEAIVNRKFEENWAEYHMYGERVKKGETE